VGTWVRVIIVHVLLLIYASYSPGGEGDWGKHADHRSYPFVDSFFSFFFLCWGLNPGPYACLTNLCLRITLKYYCKEHKRSTTFLKSFTFKLRNL
jgi:hypothetical protein